MHRNVLEVLGSGLALLAFHWNFTVVASEPCSKCSLTQRIDNFNIEIVSQKERKEGQEKGSIKGMKRIMICHPGQLQCLGGRFLFKYCLDYYDEIRAGNKSNFQTQRSEPQPNCATNKQRSE